MALQTPHYLHGLGALHQQPYSIASAIWSDQTLIVLPLGTTVAFCCRDPDATPCFDIWHHLFDLPKKASCMPNCVNPCVVNESNGFYIVKPNELVIFYSGCKFDSLYCILWFLTKSFSSWGVQSWVNRDDCARVRVAGVWDGRWGVRVVILTASRIPSFHSVLTNHFPLFILVWPLVFRALMLL